MLFILKYCIILILYWYYFPPGILYHPCRWNWLHASLPIHLRVVWGGHWASQCTPPLLWVPILSHRYMILRSWVLQAFCIIREGTVLLKSNRHLHSLIICESLTNFSDCEPAKGQQIYIASGVNFLRATRKLLAKNL